MAGGPWAPHVQAALAEVKARAVSAEAEARRRGAFALASGRLGRWRPDEAWAALDAALAGHGRLTVNFHPDRRLADGRRVVDGLLVSGAYLSQFVTGISAGSRTAYAGGERDRWERALFGDAAMDLCPPEARPIYGGLDLLGHVDGACPRFGSCFFVLAPQVRARMTFSWGDTHLGPRDVGTQAARAGLVAAWVEALVERGAALGRVAPDVGAWLDLGWVRDDVDASPGRALDGYVEAQVHGGVALAEDVTAVVVDPSFDGTSVGDALPRLAARYGFALRRGPVRVVQPEAIPPGFRGPGLPPFARAVADGYAGPSAGIDAAVIGRAAGVGAEAWAAFGGRDEVLQLLKQLWHAVVAFGREEVA
jgi:hypothetical protein